MSKADEICSNVSIITYDKFKIDESLLQKGTADTNSKSSVTSETSNQDSVDDGKTTTNKEIPTTFQNPDDSDMTFEMNENKKIWIELEAIPIYKLSNNVRAQRAYIDKSEVTPTQGVEKALAVTLNATRYKFKFLGQQDLIEQIQHEWAAYESIAQNLQQMYATIGIQTPEVIKGVFPSLRSTNLRQFFVNGKFNVDKFTQEIKDKGFLNALANEVSTASKSGHVANYRVDTPLSYKGSQRRTWELIFNLISVKQGENQDKVVLPVKLLEMLSSPSYGTDPGAKANADIILPYVFSIKTSPGNLLVCDMAILTGVNPTWKGPWYKGYPSRCELRLSFMEYRPLEQKVFYGDTDSRITIVQAERSKAFESQPEEMEKKIQKIHDENPDPIPY